MKEHAPPRTPTKDKYSVGQINLASSPAAWEELKIHLDEHKIDAVLISDPPQSLRRGKQLPFGYDWHYQHAEDDSGAGILIRKTVPHRPTETQATRSTTIELNQGAHKIRLNSFYLQPVTLKGIEDWEESIEQAKRNNVTILTGGDANAHSRWWGRSQSNPEGNTVEEVLITRNLDIINEPDSAPTFQRGSDCEQWLDITAASMPIAERIQQWRVLPEVIPSSDHNLITFEIHTGRQELQEKATWNWRQTDWKEFKEILNMFIQAIQPSDLETPDEIDRQVLLLTNAIQATMRLCVPQSKPSPYRKTWFDTEARAKYSELKNTPKNTPQHEEKKAEWKRMIQTKKLQSFQKFTEETTLDTCWEALRRLEGKKKRTAITRLKIRGQFQTEPELIANALAEHYFPEDINENTDDNHTRHSRPRSPVDSPDNTQQQGPDQERDFTTRTQVAFELLRKRRQTAPGHDDIPFIALRANAMVLANPLARIYNAIARTGHYPSQWKKGIICNILKPGKSGEEPAHYRPITLLPTMSKILEGMIAHEVSLWAETNHILPESQHGFRKGRSTRHPLWHYTHTIWTSLNTRQRTMGISLDLSSAYDRVSPQILQSKLKKWHMPRDKIHIIQSLLENRTNHIIIQEQRHHYTPSRGLPQGSPLSPILYALYAADIPVHIPENVHVQMYADDVLLYQTLQRDNNTADIQRALNGFEQWCDNNHMKLNIDKTQLVIFQRNRDQTSPTLVIKGTTINPVEEMKYLGIIFDSRMTFTSHMNKLTTKAGHRLNTIRRLSRTFWGTAPIIIRTLYQSCIQPIIQYGAEIWITRLNSQSDSRRLDRIARLASLAITGLNRTTSAETATALAHITPPSDLTLWTLLKTAPTTLRRQEEPHKPATAEAHCTPINLLRAELRRIPNKTHEEQQPRHHTRKEDREVKCLIEDEGYKDIIQKYIEDRTDRLWKTADKSQDLKRTGWTRHTRMKPWFSSTDWKRPAVSRINQILSGHSPTREYLQRRGHEKEDISCRLCGKHSETRDHMFRCEALKQQRQQIFLHEQVTIEDLGTFVQEANLYYRLDEYCKIIYQALERGPQP